MDVRAQIATVFHLDKCIGCHTCSIACKNLWTDRPGTEYMWWNNVETKPGTGYPTLWEDQEKYRGGWEISGHDLRLRIGGAATILGKIFHSSHLPLLDDYYHPWTYAYRELFDAPAGDDQPVARPISQIDGRPMEIESGPNWDDDLGGSNVYAANDPAVRALSAEEQRQLFALERLVFFYLPRICNHCVNPGCLAACPSGAIYKRGEDGIVLISQEKCRGWRFCVSGCPYKKSYYTWSTGKSEKCILCYPRQESGQVPACFQACVGRIRFLGVLLYDSGQIEAAARRGDADLVAAQRAMILDPHDPAVIAAAAKSGVHEQIVAAAQRSPVYRLVKEWELALPLRPEFRTLPMLFYVPPLLPVLATVEAGVARQADDFFATLEKQRLPLRYMAALFAGGNLEEVKKVYRKLLAMRLLRRQGTVGDRQEG
ncbi:MAG: nitrate reductase subunit beta, partial [Desulfuromonadales bacterium]|nr:nitrate reductase subunit beta [Desulfuromonadales bacterium]